MCVAGGGGVPPHILSFYSCPWVSCPEVRAWREKHLGDLEAGPGELRKVALSAVMPAAGSRVRWEGLVVDWMSHTQKAVRV